MKEQATSEVLPSVSQRINPKFFYAASLIIWISVLIRFSVVASIGAEELVLIKKGTLAFLGTAIVALMMLRKLEVKKALSSLVFVVMTSIVADIYFQMDVSIPDFRAFLLKKQLFFVILSYALGLLIHVRHMLIGILFNLIFIVIAAIARPEAYPVGNYFFFALLALSTGIIAYIVHNQLNNANEQISRQNRELKALNTSKDELFRILGHDLKTPYAQMEGLLDWMTDVDDEQERKKVLQLMKQSARKGHDLLSSLLLWATVQTEGQLVEKKTVKLLDVIEETEKFYSMNLFHKDLRLEYQVKDSLYVLTNEDMLKTVLRNLVGNAIKYSNRTSAITILTEPSHSRLKIAVIDKGMGMSQEQVNNLLKNEKNTSKLGTEKESGTGFGIGICKKMLAKIDSELSIRSQPGEGAEFSFEVDLTS